MKVSLLTLFIVSSCAHQSIRGWEGRKSQELTNHRYFKTLPLKKSGQTWVFRDTTIVPGQGHCKSLGVCPQVNQYYQYCDHVFEIIDDKIRAYERLGPCPGSTKVLTP